MFVEFNLISGFDLLTCIKFIFIAFVLIKALEVAVSALRKKVTLGHSHTETVTYDLMHAKVG